MSEESIVRKLNAAIDSLAKQFPHPLFKTSRLKDPSCPFHLEVFRDEEDLGPKGSEVLRIRVTLNQIEESDIKICRNYKMPDEVFTKIIVCKKKGRGNFEYFPISKIRK